MAQIDSSKSGREVNMEVNLVPFIDLMSVLITFLLITAVWSQVSMIQLGTSIYGKQLEQQEATPPPPVADIPLRIDVIESGFRLVIGSDTKSIPKASGKYDANTLLDELKRIKTSYPEKQDAVITVDDAVAYEFLILGMDTLLRGGFPAISVATGGPQ